MDEGPKTSFSADIRVVGVGGGGQNAITRMNWGLHKKLIIINTDAEALQNANGRDIKKIQIGVKTTRGLGCGSDPEVGERSAIETRHEIEQVLEGSDIVFIAAGMGGGTGTGASPIVAEVARSLGAVTVGVVTSPFSFEGRPKKVRAAGGIERLKKQVDALVVVPNDALLQMVASTQPNLPLKEAFMLADGVLRDGVCALSDIMIIPGLINVDGADFRTIAKGASGNGAGDAIFGRAFAEGPGCTIRAAELSISNLLLDSNVLGRARGLVISITVCPLISLHEVHAAASLITAAADPNANIIFGAVVDKALSPNSASVTVFATSLV